MHFSFQDSTQKYWDSRLNLVAVDRFLHLNSRLLWQSIQFYLLFMLLNDRSSKKSSLVFHHPQTGFNPNYLNHRPLFFLKLEVFKYPCHKERVYWLICWYIQQAHTGLWCAQFVNSENTFWGDSLASSLGYSAANKNFFYMQHNPLNDFISQKYREISQVIIN